MNHHLSFFNLLFVLHKKNTPMGFFIGLIPLIITSLSIEFFIGKLISSENLFTQPGLKAISVVFYFFIANSISLSLTALKNYSVIIKSSYLRVETIIISEILMQLLNSIVLILVYSILFQFQLYHFILIIALLAALTFILFFITSFISVLTFVFDDFDRILGIFLQMLFWLSPVIYFIRDIQTDFKYLITLNPFNIFFECVYLIFYPNNFDGLLFLISLSSFLIFMLIIYSSFRNLKNKINLFL